ncbi:GEVED domain-containing protein [Wenzhouxiangella marina]|uniref:Uncharacterized protein n=1 Tax=Wenzhouxiangella marina TaxID=1579979 RepID=A0A0K0XS64_9GAMM|nr:GEVED domain-containing protein [Wenzhouxiangella marina]AKS40466.1 hypothetical protein WM2015_75 [Wenzhouxiangella marina]MBB6088212.1 putative repeat protein (TIGR01451 family) [Wenzhouxiangella marina]
MRCKTRFPAIAIALIAAVLSVPSALAQTVTKTYDPAGLISVDGNGTYGLTLPGVDFTAADFPPGSVITDVDVSVVWFKTDGSCNTPGTGNSFHDETNFRIDGPGSNQILAPPGTWSGATSIDCCVTTDFDQSAAAIPSGVPTTGTFLPNGGDLNAYLGLDGVSSWSLSVGDTGTGDPLCIDSYSVTVTAEVPSFDMGNTDINTCTGTFYDDGGTANYSNNQQLEMLVCSDNGGPIQMDFSSFNIEAGFDGLWIWDGADRSTAPPANTLEDPTLPPGNVLFDGATGSAWSTWWGTNNPGTLIGTSGCLGFYFSSDGSVTAPGWEAAISCPAVDYGDAPDSPGGAATGNPYPSLIEHDGAGHIDAGPFLGALRDSEADGQPDATATGDDLGGSDDEDGVVFTTPLVAGQGATVDITASGAGLLNAWIDFNGNGSWADPGEQIFTDLALVAGANNGLGFSVPVVAALPQTFARFRFSQAGGLSYDGIAVDGEVEDYEVSIGACSTTVSNTNDTGPGSLRDAISCANLTPGLDTIDFDIAGPLPYVIQPASALPTITETIIIDGTTEPDFTTVPIVILAGTMAGAGASGLSINGDGSQIRGIMIANFDGPGIEIVGSDNLIGGLSPTDFNFFSGNATGVQLNGPGNGNRILGSRFSQNVGLGIDIAPVGVNANDVDDADGGPNRRQNFPDISAAILAGPNLELSYSVPSIAPNSAFPIRVEFFIADADGLEGNFFLGSDSYAEGSSPTVVLPALSAVPGDFIVATATDADGNTSEFSAAAVVVDPAVDLAITKTDGVSSVVPGLSTTYTISVSNLSAFDAIGANVSDSFPAGTSCSWTCVASAGSACTAGPVAGNINDTVDLLAGGLLTYTATCGIAASATGTLVNTATVTVPVGINDPVPGNNNATDTNTLNPQADLFATKSDGQTEATPGESVTYSIGVSNVGPSDAPGSLVTDTAPAACTAFDWTCVASGGGSCTAAGSGSISDTVDLPVGASLSYSATCTIDPAATGTLDNTVSVATAAGITEVNGTDNSSTDSDTLGASSDLSISKLAQGVPDPILIGSTFSYLISADNAGPSDATNVVVLDSLPAGLDYVSDDCGASFSAPDWTWTIGNLASGDSASCTLEVSVSALGAISNTVSISSDSNDPDGANNADTAVLIGAQATDVGITLTSDASPDLGPGDSFTYTVTGTNNGPGTATGLDFTLVLSARTSFVSSTCGAVLSGDTLSWSVASLAEFDSTSCEITVLVTGAGTILATASVATETADPDPVNNSGELIFGIAGIPVPIFGPLGLLLLMLLSLGVGVLVLRRS